MSTFWKIFGIFWLIWLVWYWTGGPRRTTDIKPYIKYDYDRVQIQKSNTELEQGAIEMLPENQAIPFDGGQHSLDLAPAQ